MSSSENRTIELLTNIPVYLNQYVGTSLYVIGNLGNLLTMVVFLKRTWRKNVCVVYFLVCLVSNTIFNNSSLLGALFTNGFNISLQNSNSFLCKLFFYVAYITSLYYPVILILASIDRLLISSQNVDTRLYSSKRLAYFSVTVSAAICFLYCLHIAIKVSVRELYPTVFLCYYDLTASYLLFFVYSTLTITAVIPLCLIILSIVAFNNVRRIRAIPRQQRREIRSMTKKDFQLLRCLYIHNLIYIIFSSLIAVGIGYSLTLNYGTPVPLQIALNKFLNDFGSFLHYIPYCTSFFIFACVSKAFRMELKRIVLKICRRDLTAVREEDNNQQESVKDNIELHDVISTIVLNAR